MTDPQLPGVITDPHTAYVAWSYALAVVSIAGLTLVGWWQARHWAARANAALQAEANAKAERAPPP